jgi:ComF family protein
MQTLQRRVRGLLEAALDAVLPPRCVITGDPVERQGMLSSPAWLALDFIAEPFCSLCGLPFDFEADPGALCVSCLDDRPHFSTARAALKYNESSRDLVLGFKHGDKTHAVLAFVPWLRRAGAEILGRADYIVPVPLHYRRQVARRYNQSMLIARALGNAAGVKILPDALKRVRPTPPQGHLNAAERARNVRGAFAFNIRHAEALKGKTVLLVDDVYTTGATANECAQALLKGGAGRVDVLTLARVVRLYLV